MYKNRDSYQLMEYTCKDCCKVELVWNSRDGVSPFMICCSACDGTMQHTNWRLDRQLPNYVVPKGARYFADYTHNRAKEAAARSILRWNGTEFEVKEGTDEWFELLSSLVEDFMKGMDILTKE